MIRVLCLLNNCSDTVIPLEAFEKVNDSRISKTIVAFFQTPKNLKKQYKEAEHIIPLGHLSMPKRVLRLAKIMKAQDIIHVHHIASGFVAAVLNLPQRKKFIVTAHSEFTRWVGRYRHMMDFIAQRADKIIANSEATYKSIPEKYKDKKRTIYNGVDLTAIKSKNVLGGVGLRMITVGRLEEVKNQSIILKALQELIVQGLDVYLSVVGDGMLYQALEREVVALEIEEKVKLLGFKTREEVYDLLPSQDLFIISSHVEGFCNSLVEAMATGLPCIVSDISIFRELYDDSMVYYFDKDNFQDLANKIHDCIKEPHIAEIKAVNAKAKVRQAYSLASCVEQHIHLYKALV